MEKPMVSIICLAYNVKDFIRNAVDGMLMQKTTFPFEILLHDDASTDGTADIVREYAEKYPDIVIPIIQTENQHSKGRGMLQKFVIPLVRGKYVAMCEADDYWTDPLKLQKQFDFLEAHPDYSLCGAKIRQINYSDTTMPDKIVAPLDHTGEVTIEQIFARRELQTFATCSLFYRHSVMQQRPADEVFPRRGDRTMVIWLALNGRVWYIDDEVGVYRRARPGSWSETNWYSGNKRKANLFLGYIGTYDQIDNYTDRKYHKNIQTVYVRYMTLALRNGAKLKDISKGKVKEQYKGLSFRQKAEIFFYYVLLPERKVASAIKKKILQRKKIKEVRL